MGTREEGFIYCNVFKSRGSWLLAGISLVALALAPKASALTQAIPEDRPFEIVAPFSPLPAERSSDTSVTIGLTVARTNPVRSTLELRGRSVNRDDPGAYKVDTHISRIPCPGEYRFHAATEDTSNGNGSSYTALLRLFSLSTSPAGARCGGRPPPRPGRMNVRMQDKDNKLFVIKGGRSNAGAFEGALSLSSFPECDKGYVLEAAFDLTDWSRSFEFKVQTINFSSTLRGKTIDEQC